MSRSVPLWVGATDDAPVPPRVRLRIFEREGGKCWITGRKIRPGEAWELDHRIALVNGGRHAEDNLFPALKDAHREKTKGDEANVEAFELSGELVCDDCAEAIFEDNSQFGVGA